MEAVFVCWGVRGGDKRLLSISSPDTWCVVQKTHPEQLEKESVQRTDLCNAGE